MRPLAAMVLLCGVSAAAQAADVPDRRPSSPPSYAATVQQQQRETLVDMFLRLETLQNELRSMRGQVETQAHEIERLKNRQRELAADLDRRVRELEQQRAAAPPAATVEAPVGEGLAAPGAAPLARATADVQKEYDAAFQLLRQGAYDKAIKSFREFLAKHLRSELADNAQYWIGEALYATGNYKEALVEFGKVLSDFPGSAKSADAQLKLGYSHYELKEWVKAREALTQVSKRFPNSRAAKTAEQRLARMKKEGH